MDSPNYRLSQRRPQACQECTKRKRKCDKQLPCGRCQRLKLDCTRETVRLRNLSAKNADEISFLHSLRDDVIGGSVNPDAAVVRRIDQRISYLQFGTTEAIRSPSASTIQRGDSSAAAASSLSTSNSSDYFQPLPLQASQQQQQQQQSETDPSLTHPAGPAAPAVLSAEPKNTDASILTALEYMAWGRSFGGCYPHRTCACHHHYNGRSGGSTSSSSILTSTGNTSFPTAQSRSLQRLVLGLPDAAVAKRLVEFHLKHLAWHHNCLHSAAFLETCEAFWRSGGTWSNEHPQWLALYLAVLSSTVYCAHNSRKFSNELGIDLGLLSSRKLFTDMIDVLYSEDFLGDVTLHSVQSIVISTEVAHNLGFSQLNAVLIGAAIRVAQCLGLHKIVNRESNELSRRTHWNELVDLEVGKRVWCQMVIQDLFAIPFNDTYGILPPYCSTDLPMNCDDDLVPKDPSIPTVSSYCRVLSQLALLMPELAEGLGPVKQRKPLQQQYEHVLRMDQKMREMVRQIPSFMLREDATDQSRAPWLSIARRSLAITAADKIIMIHRPFLFRAFQSPVNTSSYNYTRKTCVAAAMTILREHAAIAASDDLSIWTHTAFCITAAVILCFEVSYRIATSTNNGASPQYGQASGEGNDDADIETYRTAIQAARDRLLARREDVLASRGVTLIDVISLEREQNDSSDSAAASAYGVNDGTAVGGQGAIKAERRTKLINLPRVVENFFAVNNFEYLASQGMLSTNTGLNSPTAVNAPVPQQQHHSLNSSAPYEFSIMSNLQHDVPATGHFLPLPTPGGNNNLQIQEDDGAEQAMDLSEMHDFDEWFNNTFNYETVVGGGGSGGDGYQ
ncbi:hypothetical protein AAFC00_007108 [Neodothiora populina]|uniref:Zn(2)-C6 fungal-type domain-containing protein n=1 Tax=Neodothiora populina TaxID=2781224 RepID=A0ABR3PCP5_9PEZI